MTQKKNVLTGIVSNKNLFLCSQNALLHALLVLLCLKKDILIMNKKSAASFNISKLKQVTENLHLTIKYCESGSNAPEPGACAEVNTPVVKLSCHKQEL